MDKKTDDEVTKTAEARARQLFTDDSYRVDLKKAKDIEGVLVIFYSLLDQIEAKATVALNAHAAEARREALREAEKLEIGYRNTWVGNEKEREAFNRALEIYANAIEQLGESDDK